MRDEPEPPARTGGPEGRAGAPWLRLDVGALIAVGLYAVLRLIGVVTLWVLAERRGLSMGRLLTDFDGKWYQQIALHGYDKVIPIGADGRPETTDLAFFPLYPGLVAAVDPVLPGGVSAAQVLVAWLAGFAAAWALYKIGVHLRDRRTGILLAAVWAVVPHGIVESMGYSETLFTALAAWSLYALLRRQWLTAGVLCLFAGLSRPTGPAVIAAVGLVALVAVLKDPRQWRPWAAAIIAPLGTLGYFAWLAVRIGRPDAYFYIQREAWNMSFDWGASTVRTFGTLLDRRVALALVVTTLVVAAGVALFVIAVGERVPWPLLVFAAVMLIPVLGGDDYYWAKARFLLPAFPLLIPVAYALARARSRVTPVVVLALLTAISTWYGLYLALVWRSSP